MIRDIYFGEVAAHINSCHLARFLQSRIFQAGAQIMSLIIMVIAVVSEAVTIATQRDPVEQVIVVSMAFQMNNLCVHSSCLPTDLVAFPISRICS